MHFLFPLAAGFVADGLHRCHNVGVGATTANVPAESLLNILVTGSTRFLQQSGSGHDLAACAVTALITVVFHKCGLNRMHSFGRAETVDGGDFWILLHRCQEKAAIGTAAVDVYRARAALAVIATLLGASEVEGLA
jgi:hypothetical protein